MKGTILRSTGSWYDILGEDHQRYKGRLRGKFKIKELNVTNPIAVGDHVVFEEEENNEEGTVAINEILPRENYIIRKSTHKASSGHLIATNIDQSVLVVTLALPRTSLGFIDRFLVTCEAFRIPAILLFNKSDMLNEVMNEEIQELTTLYSSIGYTCLNTSSITGEGMDELKKILQNKVSLFSGHSGVGKSSLVNNLIPELNLKTSTISDFSLKGVHTTTFAEMFEIDQQTFIIDTPGIKELGIFEIGEEELSHYFPEMRALLGECKFHNCRHMNEPKCAVIEKVKTGEIALSRFESYLSMLDEEDNRR